MRYSHNMISISYILKCAVTAFVATLMFQAPVFADDAELEALFEGLRSEDPSAISQIEGRIYDIWSQSGSDSIDLLLDRGRKALAEEDAIQAIEHLTALIDHAPEFAEGYNARATAFFQSGKYGLALADIQKTLALNPRHFDAMSGLALILEELGHPDDALAAWREVEALHPHREGLQDALTRLERKVEGADI